MTAEVADCDECGCRCEFFETHDEWRDDDPRTEREKYQDLLDEIVRGANP